MNKYKSNLSFYSEKGWILENFERTLIPEIKQYYRYSYALVFLIVLNFQDLDTDTLLMIKYNTKRSFFLNF